MERNRHQPLLGVLQSQFSLSVSFLRRSLFKVPVPHLIVGALAVLILQSVPPLHLSAPLAFSPHHYAEQFSSSGRDFLSLVHSERAEAAPQPCDPANLRFAGRLRVGHNVRRCFHSRRSLSLGR